MAKVTRRQLRKMILTEMSGMDYGQAMTLQRIIADCASFPVDDGVIKGLLIVVGNDGSFETQEARDAILALQDVSSGDELESALADVESYIADALRAQGRHLKRI